MRMSCENNPYSMNGTGNWQGLSDSTGTTPALQCRAERHGGMPAAFTVLQQGQSDVSVHRPAASLNVFVVQYPRRYPVLFRNPVLRYGLLAT